MSGAAEKQGTSSQAQRDSSLQQPRKAADDATTSNSGTSGNGHAHTEGGSGGGESSKAQDGGSPSRPASSPEPNCAICLGVLENKSFTDSCFHMFCFVCLQEWSKVKAECPLCKQPFKSIIHNVRSYDVYDQFYLDHRSSDPRHYRPFGMGWDFDRSFRYRSTLTMDHRYMRIRAEHDLRVHGDPFRSRPSDNEPSLQRPSRHRMRIPHRSQLWRHHGRQPVTTTVDFRRRIYENGYQVTDASTNQRYRQVSPEFFSANPAQTHRLMPWLNRELNALLYCHETQVQFVMELILDLIKRFAIDSEEFYQHISPYIGRHTRHFMHEFLTFARSPYHMSTYDTKAIYQPSTQLVSSSESSDNESDIVVIDDDDAEEAGRPGQDRREAAGPSGEGRGREPPAVRLGFDSSYLPTPAPSQLRALLEGTSSNNHSSSSWDSSTMATGWDSPTPDPAWSFGHHTSSSPVNVEDSSDSDASTIIDPTYIPSQPKTETDTTTRADDDSDSEDVIFVGYDKPWEERSPIMLTSDSEDEALSKYAKKLAHNHKKKLEGSAGPSNDVKSSRMRHRKRSRSLTPPAAYRRRSRSPHTRSSSHRSRPTSTEGSSHRQAENHHHRRQHCEEERLQLSSYPSRLDKRSHSSSSQHSRSSHKKRRQDKGDDLDGKQPSSLHKKKGKHKKKHKKHKDKRDGDEHSKRRKEGQSSSKNRDYRVAASSGQERHSHSQQLESFKKHPSGHKKSRIPDSGDHISDGRHRTQPNNGPFSHCSVTTSTSTSTTTSVTERECSANSIYPLWSPLQMLMSESLQQRSLPMFPSMDVPPTWENIKRLAGLISLSATASQLGGRVSSTVGPGQSSSEPVIITTSSDESDREDAAAQNDFRSGDSFGVAKTVVVPCSSQMGVPTEAIDPSVTTASSAEEEEELIDVDSLSSCGKTTDSESDEVVDVESVEGTEREDSQEVVSSLEGGDSAVAEVSAEPDIPLPVSFKTVEAPPPPPPHSFSIESILNRDVFMGVGMSSLPLFDQASLSSPDTPSTVASQDLFAHSQAQTFESLPGGSASLRIHRHSPQNDIAYTVQRDDPASKDRPVRGNTSTGNSGEVGGHKLDQHQAVREEYLCGSPQKGKVDSSYQPSCFKQANSDNVKSSSCGQSARSVPHNSDPGHEVSGFLESDTEEENGSDDDVTSHGSRTESMAQVSIRTCSMEADVRSCDSGNERGDCCDNDDDSESQAECQQSGLNDTASADGCDNPATDNVRDGVDTSFHSRLREHNHTLSRLEHAIGPDASTSDIGPSSNPDNADMCDSSSDRGLGATGLSQDGMPSSVTAECSSDFELASSSDDLDSDSQATEAGPSTTSKQCDLQRTGMSNVSPQQVDPGCMDDSSIVMGDNLRSVGSSQSVLSDTNGLVTPEEGPDKSDNSAPGADSQDTNSRPFLTPQDPDRDEEADDSNSIGRSCMSSISTSWMASTKHSGTQPGVVSSSEHNSPNQRYHSNTTDLASEALHLKGSCSDQRKGTQADSASSDGDTENVNGLDTMDADSSNGSRDRQWFEEEADADEAVNSSGGVASQRMCEEEEESMDFTQD